MNGNSNKMSLYTFLMRSTEVGELCVIREFGYICAVVLIDYQDIFNQYLSTELKDKPVKHHEWGLLPIVDEDNVQNKVPCHYIDV